MPHSWSSTLRQLSAGTSLSREEAASALSSILHGDGDDDSSTAFLVTLTAKGETPEEMAGFLDAMMANAATFRVDDNAMDIVGTGGDQLRTVNISTMAALTVAACGVPVAKHGNRAASSSVGTADVLEALGVRVDVDGATVARCVRTAGMGFCFAQRFHPGLRHLGPVRRSLGYPTVFNVLGPLANPAQVRRLLVGVADAEKMNRMAEVLQGRGVDHAVLVRGDEGLDELSLGSPSTLIDVRPAGITRRHCDAGTELGTPVSLDHIVGGDIATNVAAVHHYLDATPGPVYDTIVANAGLALVVADVVGSLPEGVLRARDAVDSGAAREVLTRLIVESNR